MLLPLFRHPYTLTPLHPKPLLTFHYNTLDSTNAAAKRLSAANPGRVLLVSAATQTAGRGRLGRVWKSPAGGAWFTLAYPAPEDPIVAQAAPLAVAAAVVEVLIETMSNPPLPRAHALTIKWPNDLLLNNRKVCGILCERTLAGSRSSGSAAPSTLILGIGVNANVDPCELTQGDMRYPATSLVGETHRRGSVPELIDAAGRRIAAKMDDLCTHGLNCDVIRTVKRHLAWRGCRVSLTRGSEQLEGVVMGIDGLGRLLLQTDANVEVINSGEVTTVRAVAEPACLCV